MPGPEQPPKTSPIQENPSRFAEQRANIYFRCVEDCNEPIMLTDQGGRLIYTNPAWTRIYGYSAAEAQGETPRLLRSEHQSDEFYRAMWRQILNPKIGTWKGRLINRAKDGREVPVLLTITPYKSETGETLGYMGIALDLSEQERLERHLVHQEKLITIGELTSGLAHEIGTPIGVIRGRAEMLLMSMTESPAVAKTLDIIIKQSDRISSLINTLLRFSRAGSVSELSEVAPVKVAKEVVELLAEKMRKRGVEIRIDLPEDLRILGDANKLEQIFINLMMNSLQAFEEFHSQQPRIEIGVATRGTTGCEIRVSDNGPGIPAAIRGRIFDPFFTTKPAGKGTGLGLSIVSRLMHEMSGTARLDENFSGGACILLHFQVPK